MEILFFILLWAACAGVSAYIWVEQFDWDTFVLPLVLFIGPIGLVALLSYWTCVKKFNKQ